MVCLANFTVFYLQHRVNVKLEVVERTADAGNVIDDMSTFI